MSEFSHVTSNLIRSLLEGEDLSNDSIADCLSLTENHWENDAHNPDVPFDLYSVRGDHLGEAVYYWNEEGDTGSAVEALRNYWRN